MNFKAFYVDALQSALDLGIGTPADILRHVTPDVLAAHLPRPLWARLLTVCLGAPRVDARIVVETIGVPNLCEHVPSATMWAVIVDIAARTLGKPIVAAAPTPIVESPVTKTSSGPARSVLSPPPDVVDRPTSTPPTATPVAVGPSIPGLAASSEPLADLISELEQDDRPPSTVGRPRSPTAQRFRQSNTNARTPLGSSARRPQAQVPSTLPTGTGRQPRTTTDVAEPEPETAVGTEWSQRNGGEIPVDDSQLVDWKTDTGTNAITGDDDFSDLGGRKR